MNWPAGMIKLLKIQPMEQFELASAPQDTPLNGATFKGSPDPSATVQSPLKCCEGSAKLTSPKVTKISDAEANCALAAINTRRMASRERIRRFLRVLSVGILSTRYHQKLERLRAEDS